MCTIAFEVGLAELRFGGGVGGGSSSLRWRIPGNYYSVFGLIFRVLVGEAIWSVGTVFGKITAEDTSK